MIGYQETQVGSWTLQPGAALHSRGALEGQAQTKTPHTFGWTLLSHRYNHPWKSLC